jgi:DNA-binding FrmR family transcriptional regulator
MKPQHLTTNKQKAQRLAKQAGGTIQKVYDMIESDQYCPEVIQQIDSVIGLLKTCKKQLLTGHLQHCLLKQLQENETKTLEELIQIYKLSE